MFCKSLLPGQCPDDPETPRIQETTIGAVCGVPVGSLMLKLDKEIGRVNGRFSVVYFLIHLCCHSFLIYEEGG